jgi:hypothetical protein
VPALLFALPIKCRVIGRPTRCDSVWGLVRRPARMDKPPPSFRFRRTATSRARRSKWDQTPPKGPQVYPDKTPACLGLERWFWVAYIRASSGTAMMHLDMSRLKEGGNIL